MSKSYGESLLGELLHLVLIDNRYYKDSNIKNNLTLLSNQRPKFLHGLEIDFYIPELQVAFEFQGQQHYNIVYDFKQNNYDFLKRILYDLQKDIFCKEQNILLIRLNCRQLTPQALKNTIRHEIDSNHNLLKKIVFYKPKPKIWDTGEFLLGKEKVKNYLSRVKDYQQLPINKDNIPMNCVFYHNLCNTLQKIIDKLDTEQETINLNSYLKAGLNIQDIAQHLNLRTRMNIENSYKMI